MFPAVMVKHFMQVLLVKFLARTGYCHQHSHLQLVTDVHALQASCSSLQQCVIQTGQKQTWQQC